MDGSIETDEIVSAARDWVLTLGTDEVGPAEMRKFGDWLAANPAHVAAFEREREFWQKLCGLEAASARLGRPAKPAPRRRSFRPSLAGGALIAACLTLLVFGSDLGIWLKTDFATGVGERRTILLADGSRVHLNTGSALAVSYDSDGRRMELLRGEALFEVEPGRPFVVSAAGGETRALGTAFVVRMDEDRTQVTVTEGRVSVSAPNDADGTGVQLGRGQRTIYRGGAAPEPVLNVDPQSAASWRAGAIRIDGLPLEAALAELGRYRPGKIVLLGDSGRFRPVSGIFDIDNIDAAVTGLAATQKLTVTHVTSYLTILR